MNVLLIYTLVIGLVQEFASADLQNIQNANPLSIDLSNPSDIGPVNNGDAAIDDHKLGGYRPLYPPYFNRDSTNQPQQQQTYYDKEYYSRGAQFNGFDDRLDRKLQFRPAAPAQQQQYHQQQQQQQQQLPTFFNNRQQYAREFSNYHHAYTNSFLYSFRFPNS